MSRSHPENERRIIKWGLTVTNFGSLSNKSEFQSKLMTLRHSQSVSAQLSPGTVEPLILAKSQGHDRNVSATGKLK